MVQPAETLAYTPQETCFTHKCFQDYYEAGIDDELLARGELISSFAKAAMLDYGFPFM